MQSSFCLLIADSLEILTSDRVLLPMRDARIVLLQVKSSEIWQGFVWGFVHVAQKVCCWSGCREKKIQSRDAGLVVLSFFVCREDTSLPSSRLSAKTLDPGSGIKATSQNGYQDYASSGRGATWPSGIQATESYWQVILLSLLVMFIFLFVYLWINSLFFSVIVWSSFHGKAVVHFCFEKKV
jgi:hypothetical protein